MIRSAAATAYRMTAPFAGPVLLVVGATAATYSVVRFDLRIVGTYVALAVFLLLALVLAGRTGTAGSPGAATVPALARLGRYPAAAGLALAGVSTLRLHAFSYLHPADAASVRWILAGAALTGAALLIAWPRHGADAALGVALTAYLVTGAMLIRLDPAPRIDVWYTLQGAADAIGAGHNLYTEVWTAPTGIMSSFTYLPWMAVLLAPGRWLLGDVRWALMAITVLGALALRGYTPRVAARTVPAPQDAPDDTGQDRTAPGRTEPAGLAGAAPGTGTAGEVTGGVGDLPPTRAAVPTRGSAAAGALLLLLPGTATVVEQAWTEPVLLACIAGASLAWRGRRPWLAALLLALGMASKQHLALLVPLLLLWPRFGVRRTLAVGTGAGLLLLPWFLADPAAMWHDTVTFLVHFPPLVFSDTLFIAALRELAWTPPFWLTGAIVLGTVGTAAWTIRRRNPDLGTLLRWAALVLFVASLVNKQAFYNQFWLVGALLLASWAVPADAETPDGNGPDRSDPAEVSQEVPRQAGAAA